MTFGMGSISDCRESDPPNALAGGCPELTRKWLVVTRSSDHRFEGDAVAEAFELEQCAAATVLGVSRARK